MPQNSIVNFIDADTMLFLIAWNLQETEEIEKCEELTDSFVKQILNNTNCHYYLGFLGGNGNFRKTLTNTYKASRAERPAWLTKWEPVIRKILIEKWGFVASDNIESEDAVIICANHYKDKANVIISHTDKDLNFWEGNHYNYQKHEHWYSDSIGKLELTGSKSNKVKGYGLKFFYSQLIMGDPTDGITGIKGKGDMFAYKLLNECKTEYSLFRRTYLAYLQFANREHFKLTWKLVRMLGEPDHGFVIPELVTYKTIKNKEVEIL